jgi:predicted peptidase
METAVGIIGVLLLIIAIVLGGKINTERYWLAQWINRGPEKAIALAKPFEARSYVNSKGDTLKYRLLAPMNYDSSQTYPLAVCLHGGGGRGTDNITQIEGSWTAQLLSEYRNREKYPAFIFVPQCSPASSWGGGLAGLSVVDEIVFDAIDQLEKEFPIDKKRRYVMGESLGGYGTWHFIATRPAMFAAAVPICGGGDPSLANSIVNVPVWAFHGAKDRSVPVRLSREMVDAIKDAGGNPMYTEYPEEGHIISEQVTTTPGLLDWVFAQRRD